MRQITFLILVIMISNTNLFAQKKTELKEVKSQLDFFEQKILIPTDYQFKSVWEVKVDKKDAYWFRYEKSVNTDLNGEHFSFLVTKNYPYSILGYTAMDAKYLDLPLCSEEQCIEVAEEFLKKIAPELSQDLELQWVDRHDEEIVINGQKRTLSGMKYKCYRPSLDDYAWVIVASDGSVITYERDILWSNGMSKRITNKWLHDIWLTEHKFQD